MENNIFLSICIPTYNRSKHVYNLVNNLLNIDSEEFEVIVQDNCSSDETEALLESIIHPRFKYIRNEKNIGGKLNSALTLLNASGKFSFLCLDRDSIEPEYLPILIDNIKLYNDISFGYCVLEKGKDLKNTQYNEGFDSLYNMCFLSKHPSGNFYNTNILKNLSVVKEIEKKYKDFDFIHEFFNSEASFKGSSLKLNIPIIKTGYTENKNDFATHKSYSYNEKNFYFNPLKRQLHFLEYLNEIKILNISSKERQILILKVFFHGLVYAIYTYKNAMKDKKICSHYNIEPRNISFFELTEISFCFSSFFIRGKNSVPFLRKLIVVFTANIKLILFLFKNKFFK